MFRLSRWHITLAWLALFAMVTLVACGAPVEAPSGATDSSAAPSASQAATNASPATSTAVNSAASPAAASAAGGETVTLTIESWRNDDLTIWQNTLIPAFEKRYPNIKLNFQPTAPTEYNAALNTKLQGGTAGDLITCRPFDASLELFNQGNLAPLTDLPGMENFSDVAKSAWITDDGTTPFCVPMASVIHGFIYNQDAFDKLGLTPPTTQAEFLDVLEKIKQDGTYTPLAMGTADQWEAATMGFQNIGPNYWKGEEGRKALIEGAAKFTDAPYVDTWKALEQWKPYLPQGYEAVKYPDSQQLFTLGQAAIFPAGSWEIALFNKDAQFKLGAFKPPVANAGDQCYISDHTDIGIGMNAKTANPAQARQFLEWVASAEFADLYSNALPGFFSLSNNDVTVQDPLAQQFLSWRDECESTIRNSYQILSRGEPNLENELWRVNAQLLNGALTPEQAAQEIQTGLDKWYKPGQPTQ